MPRRSSDHRPGRVLKGRDEVPVHARGGLRSWAPDLYHQLLRMPWPWLIAVFVAVFLGFNLFFAWLYTLDPTGVVVEGRRSNAGRFWEMVFFSIQTVSTIGYGNMYPASLHANILVIVEITLGIMLFALVTGIAFARFSRPTARILFSRVAVIHDIDGVPTLSFRAVNRRHNLIFEAHVAVSLLTDEEVGGRPMRRFHDLELVRDANPVFALSWTVMHPIDEDSPLRGWLAHRRAPATDELVVVISGTDDHSGHAIHGRWAYGADDIRWDEQLVDIVGQDDEGERVIDYTRFHVTEPSAP